MYSLDAALARPSVFADHVLYYSIDAERSLTLALPSCVCLGRTIHVRRQGDRTEIIVCRVHHDESWLCRTVGRVCRLRRSMHVLFLSSTELPDNLKALFRPVGKERGDDRVSRTSPPSNVLLC